MSAEQKQSSDQAFDLFHELSKAEIALLRARVGKRHVTAGETFIQQGQAGDCLYIVRSGEIEVRRADKLLARHGAGHVVGEMALLNREPRNADVIATTDCTLDRLATEDFHEVCRKLPSLKLLLTRLVAHRLNWSHADVLTRKIGRYHVVEQLGAGSMGWVFRAVCEPSATGETVNDVALKMLPHPLVQRPGFVDRFRHEASTVQRLRHENIVALHETFELYGTIFLVLEYVAGRNACHWVEVHGLPGADNVRCVVRAVARALLVAHAQGIVHRDVKSENVMIRTDGVVKLTDFGIATSCNETSSAGGIALTPAYAAPEMFTQQRIGPGGDFYSLGVMAYELLTGQCPFVGESLEDWERVHKTVAPPALREHCPQPPKDLEGFVQAALIKDPEARLQAVRPWLQRWEQDPRPTLVSCPPPRSPVVKIAHEDSSTIVSGTTKKRS